MIVKYEGAYDEAGEERLRNKGPNAWDPWDLLRTDEKNERITGAKSVRRQGKLGDSRYDVTITSVYGNSIPSQHCGVHVTGGADQPNNGTGSDNLAWNHGAER